jgi:hypothetical protein
VGPVLHLARSRRSVGRADTSCRDPETSQRQRLGAHEPCWPQDLLLSAIPSLGPDMTPWPSPCSPCTCPPSLSMLLLSALEAAAAPVAAHRPHVPRCACAAAQRPAPGVVGWLSHEARPTHYSLPLHIGREGAASVCSKPW